MSLAVSKGTSKFPSSVRLQPSSFPPFGRSNRLSTLFKLAVMQLTHNAVQLTHNAVHDAAIKHSLQLIHKHIAAEMQCSMLNAKYSFIWCTHTLHRNAVYNVYNMKCAVCTFLMKLNSVHYQLHPLQCNQFRLWIISFALFCVLTYICLYFHRSCTPLIWYITKGIILNFVTQFLKCLTIRLTLSTEFKIWKIQKCTIVQPTNMTVFEL